ncbi:protein trapped in endoderm-1-like isoform X2 [Macrobrachium rosenbergii]|uniref:protein trapped in endoderm-1-like isoform X2 n=1 Tax=Macrobrachium rosenbergii TaxID=79674 RepID=UPI0034D57C91
MGTYSTGMIDYTGGGGSSSYDYQVDQDTTLSSTNLNNAIQADKNMALTGAAKEEDGYNTTSLLLASTTFAPAIVSSNSTMPQYPSDMLIVTAVCAFVIAILGTCGNLLTIIALPMSKKLRTTATAFVVNLAVVELLFCALILPMSGLQYMHLQRTRESLLTDNDCVFFTVTRYTLTQVELQTILAIALTRALAVSVPKMYTFLNKPSVIGGYITFIWLYSFVLRLPTALGYLGSYGFNSGTMECDMRGGDYVSRIVMIIVDALIPVIVILLLYVFVFIMVKRSSYRVARSTIKNNSVKSIPPPTSSGGASTSSNSNNQRKGSNSSFKSLRARLTHQSSTVSQRLCTNRRDMRVARTIFIIFLVILICSVPVMLVHMFDRNVKYPVQFLALHILYWVQYCLNVVIYVLMNRQYRDAYVDCLARVFPQFKRHHGRKFFWEKASFSSKPPQNVPTSTRPRLDSAEAAAAADSGGSEPEPVATGNHPPPIGVQGRLSTIPEGHSSSAANDSVFSDPGKKEKEVEEKNTAEDNPYYEDQKCFESDASDSEDEIPEAEKKALMDDREHWVTQNGSTGGNLPNDESKV